MRCVRVEWEGPFSIEEALRLNGRGLYQIYGHHIIFGANSLLYVGKAEGVNFDQRFNSRKEKWLLEEEGVSIRIGRIMNEDYAYDPPNWPDWRKVLGAAEALTIYWHSPPYNGSNISEYNGQLFRVVNLGERGCLVAEYRSDEQKECRSDKRKWFSNLSAKAINPNVETCYPLPKLDERDLQLVGEWCEPSRYNLNRTSLIEDRSKKEWELDRLLSARSAEKVAANFYSLYGKIVEDISITQIDENSKPEWEKYDLNVDGLSIDVKNSRRSQNSPDRYTKHCVPKFKRSRENQDVKIAGVFSPYLSAYELLGEPEPYHKYREIQFLGEITRKKLQELKNEFNDLIDFAEPNPASKYFLPPWVFDYPEYVYTERDKALKELKDFTNLDSLKEGTFGFNLIPVAIAAGIDLTGILDNKALDGWERSFLDRLRNRIEKYGLSLPFLFLTILEHFLYMTAYSKTVSDFEPSKYRRFLFLSDKPLGIYDPLKTIDALINALSTLWTAENGLIRTFHVFRLQSFNILQGKSNLNDSSWTTLIAHCGGRLEGGSACGKNPLVLGETKHCESGRLICPNCGFCCDPPHKNL